VDRIRKLVPLFEGGKFLIPRTMHRTLHDGKTSDLIRVFVEEEYTLFPVAAHDDILDCLARIADPDLKARAPDHAGGRGGTGSRVVMGSDGRPLQTRSIGTAARDRYSRFSEGRDRYSRRDRGSSGSRRGEGGEQG
jgi:hypothetical protein